MLTAKLAHPEAPVEGLGKQTLAEHFDKGDAMIRAYFAEGPVENLISVEQPFSIPNWEARPFVGIWTSWCRARMALQVVELKTSRAAWSEAQARLSLQATVYAAALGAREREVSVHFRVLTKTKEPKVQHLVVTRGPAEVALLEETLSDLSRGLGTGAFPRNLSAQACPTCPYRRQCLGVAWAA